jgi:hypothetical protein
LGLLPVSIFSSSCSSLSLNDHDFQFGETNPALRIEALLLVVAMPDVLVPAELLLDAILTLWCLLIGVPANRFLKLAIVCKCLDCSKNCTCGFTFENEA